MVVAIDPPPPYVDNVQFKTRNYLRASLVCLFQSVLRNWHIISKKRLQNFLEETNIIRKVIVISIY